MSDFDWEKDYHWYIKISDGASYEYAPTVGPEVFGDGFDESDDFRKDLIAMGNYFDTKEEAQEAFDDIKALLLKRKEKKQWQI